jgi:hypothetical protein
MTTPMFVLLFGYLLHVKQFLIRELLEGTKIIVLVNLEGD